MADPDSAAVALVGQAELADIRALKIHGEVVDFVIADSQNNVNLRKLTARVNHDEDSRALFYTFSFAIDCTEGDDEARVGTKIDLEF